MSSSLGFYIPEEILVGNILERLPPKSLIRFRCVCKLWRDIIGSSSFIRAHHDRSLICRPNKDNTCILACNVEYGELRKYSLFVTTEEVWDARLRFTHPWFFANDIIIYGSSNGLVCFSCYGPALRSPICLWNPSIGKSRIITSPPMDENSYYIARERTLISLSFGFHPQRNDYKAVRILFNQKEAVPLLEVQIYTLSTNSWKRINVGAASRPPLLNSRIDCFRQSAFLNGIAYLLLRKDSKYKMVSFDTDSEECTEIMVPELKDEFGFPEIRVFRESICICDTHSEGGHVIIDMWILQVNQYFQMFHTVTMRGYSRLLGFSIDYDQLVLEKGLIILYNLKSKQFSNTGIRLGRGEATPVNRPGAYEFILCDPCYAGVYTESLVLLDD